MWSSTLWQLRGDFIALAGDYATGAQQADKLVLQSHFPLTSPNVTFSVLVKKLIPGTTYAFTVRAVNEEGNSAWAEPLVVTTMP
jgi:hypothetical protein